MYKLIDLSYQKKIRSKEELIKHMRSFKLKLNLSVGIWYFTPGGGRFHDRYVEEKNIKERLKMAEELADYGVKGIEAHFPAEVNRDNLHLYKKLEKDTGIRLVGIPFSHFFDKDFEFGSLSNPDKKTREKAIKIAADGLKLVKETGANCAISWPGIDGYMYSLGTNYYWMWNNFEESVAASMDETPGIRVAIEPKPYEPAPNNIYRTTAEGILAAQRIESKLKNPENKKLLKQGYTLVGLNPEIGHVRMGYEDAPSAYSLSAFEGRLAHTHFNSQPLGNYDQDLNVGVVEWQNTEALLYALKMIGYKEFLGIDINPEHMPVKKAIEINSKVLNIMNERIEKLPHERIIDCYLNPSKNRGELETILLESMKGNR
ncbi:MAG: TIM barrel protein [Elusimicrobia bacterium]|nr:TIM barrel protein [Elusimicrobiota bacterium]